MPDGRLDNRLAWITGLRLGFISLLLGATAFFYLRGALSQYPHSQAVVLGSIGAAFALTAIYATLLRAGRTRGLAEAQIVLDQVTWTAIVYVSGGATSGATTFYGLTCLVGAILIGQRGALLAALSGVGAFALLCACFAFGWLPPPSDQARLGSYVLEWDGMVYPLAVNALGIVVVAILSAYLAERLRRTGGQLREANERAEAAERLAMLGRLAAGLAHEIRNPLGAISGSIEMLRESAALSDEDRRLCEIVQREAGRLNHLVSDMMDLSKPRKPEPEAVDVAALARDVVDLAARSERSGAGDVAVKYDGPATPLRAICDAAQMRQVLWNLVRNAVQASGAGTTVTVSVKMHEPDERVLMAVTDEGEGIEPGSEKRIFDAFFTTRAKGAGLGLAVVRRIIDEHAYVGATIEVRGAQPKGATFEVGLAAGDEGGRREKVRHESPSAETVQ